MVLDLCSGYGIIVPQSETETRRKKMRTNPTPKPKNMPMAVWIALCEKQFNKILVENKDVFIRIKNSDAI